MVDRSVILGVSVRVVVALVAAAGLALLFVPSVARGLGRPDDAAPWTLTRPSAESGTVVPNLLESDGLRVSGSQWSENRRAWSSMSEAERRELTDKFARLQGLIAAERQALVSRYKTLREKSETEREQLRRQAAALAKFEASLSRQDMAALDSLSGKSRATYLVKLWRASRGLD